ncbi:MAG: hypothetical protein H6808_08465 [Phycisphaera sp.]|nr:hypothetical protein [Phycisphaera sp.]
MNTIDVDSRAVVLYNERSVSLCKQIDKMFACLMPLQFLAATLAAVFLAPSTWEGLGRDTNVHIATAIVVAGIATAIPTLMIWRMSGTRLTRNVIAISQVCFSILFIHLSGGRMESHFHIFGSLAFLSLYREWSVLILPTCVVAIDYVVRSVYWTGPVYGIESPTPWRIAEFVGWVLYEDVFLIYGCIRATKEMKQVACNLAKLESMKAVIEHEVELRTRELSENTDALQAEIIERSMLQDQLLHAQKLESIGQLAAGIAHEINTPCQYVGDNTRFVKKHMAAFLSVIDSYAEQIDPNAPAMGWQERNAEIQDILVRLDYDFIREEIPLALTQSLEGLERITKIVGAMKEFSHPGSAELAMADINRAIESTVTVCSNRWKHVASIEMALDREMPAVPCLIAEFNQVILNLVTNAADAIAERQGADKGRIQIITSYTDEWAEIKISDNGTGIPDSVIAKMYDPFFTTKEVGKGTGQGLAISRDIVVNKHNGSISCESVHGEGTVFTLRLPLKMGSAVKAVA